MPRSRQQRRVEYTLDEDEQRWVGEGRVRSDDPYFQMEYDATAIAEAVARETGRLHRVLMDWQPWRQTKGAPLQPYHLTVRYLTDDARAEYAAAMSVHRVQRVTNIAHTLVLLALTYTLATGLVANLAPLLGDKSGRKEQEPR